MKNQKLINRIIYLFARNKDLSKIKKYYKIFIFFFENLRLRHVYRTQGMAKIKNSFTTRKGESWVILNYKRVISPEEIPVQIGSLSYVLPETFSMHCQTLKQYANVIRLDQLIAILQNGDTPPDGTVVFTFDGGHADFLLNASKSILQNGLTATISIPSGYINTKALLLDDMLATALMLFKLDEVPLKKIEGLSDAMFDSLISTTDDGIPNSKSIQTLFTLILALKKQERLIALKSLSKQIDGLDVSLPEWDDFLFWKDIQYLSSLGFQFISMLHSHPIITELDKNELATEITESEHMFSAASLPIYKYFTIPYGIYNEATLARLKRFDYKYGLAGFLGDPISQQDGSKLPVLRRTLICEDNAATKDLFLKRIWDF